MKQLLLAACATLAAAVLPAAAAPIAPVDAPAVVTLAQWDRGGGDTTVIQRRGMDGDTTVIRRERRGGWDRDSEWRTGTIRNCRTVVTRTMDDDGNRIIRRVRRCG